MSPTPMGWGVSGTDIHGGGEGLQRTEPKSVREEKEHTSGERMGVSHFWKEKVPPHTWGGHPIIRKWYTMFGKWEGALTFGKEGLPISDK